MLTVKERARNLLWRTDNGLEQNHNGEVASDPETWVSDIEIRVYAVF